MTWPWKTLGRIVAMGPGRTTFTTYEAATSMSVGAFSSARDDVVIAMGGFVRRSPTEAEIKRMRVHPDFQRRGFGRLLLEELERRARSGGCRTIRLDTTDRQTAAQRFYESAGYRETGRRQVGRFLLIDYLKTVDG